MLEPEEFFAVDYFSDLFIEFEDFAIEQFAIALKNSVNEDYYFNRTKEIGLALKKIEKKLSESTKYSEKELEILFRKMNGIGYNNDKYKMQEIDKKLPDKMSANLTLILKNIYNSTKKTMKNITKTTGFDGYSFKKFFVKELDLANIKITTGVATYDQAVVSAIKPIVEQGVTTVRFPKVKRNIETRRA